MAAYKSQFAGQITKGFDLSGLKATGGPVGRATAKYRASYTGAPATTGTMTWNVIRDHGKPRIMMISGPG